MARDLQTFFNPKSIAVIGVSQEPQKVGHIVAKNIIDQGYSGELYLVNPHLEELFGKRIYKSIQEIDATLDLVILALPAHIALPFLDEVHALGIKHVVMYAAGFKETDDEGKKREQELIKKAADYDITLLGPNCLGFINTTAQINATFLKHTCPKGNIGMVSQSGALGSAIIDQFVDHTNLGLSYFISLGNKTILDESDCLEYLSKDSETEVIGMYIEDVKNGARFKEVLAKATRLKPVVILKSGVTQEGSTAALSHTGGLGGDAEVYNAVFRQTGAIIAETYEEYVTILKMYSFKKIPTSSAILILSNAGGVGVLLTDQLVKHSLSMITISEHTKKEIEQSLDSEGLKKITIHNPIDLLGDASAFDYRQAILSSIQQQDIGAVIVLLTPQANTQIEETAKVIISAQNHFIKPIFPVFMGQQSVKQAHEMFEKNKILSFDSYELLPVTIRKVIDSYEYMTKDLATSYSPDSLAIRANEGQIKDMLELAQQKAFLNLQESMHLIQLAGVPVVPIHVIHHEEEITVAANKVTFPLVAKIASDEITHKTEVGGVLANIDNVEELKAAFKKLSKIAKNKGCYVQKMVKGYEIFIGAKRDPRFGPVIFFGLGGIYVELLKETEQFVYPFTLKEFEKKLANSKLEKLCKGFRGTKSIKMNDLYSIGMALGFLLDRFTEIEAIDINPLFIANKQLLAADARVILTAK